MKKAMMIVGVMILGAAAWAAAEVSAEETIFDLKPGAGVTEIDVAGLPPLIALRVKVDRLMGVPSMAPEARVASTYGDFGCEILGVELAQSGMHHELIMQDVFLVRVAWEPGVDLSGCALSITEPFSNRLYPVDLFMSY